MNLLNVVLFTTMPPALQAVNLPATAMLSIIMCSRLVLNIRNPGQQTDNRRVAASKTTQYRTGMSTTVDHSETATTMTTYQMHDLKPNMSDAELGAVGYNKTSTDKAQGPRFEA